ncbi:MAG: hypothetical protein QXV79_03650 [Thermofilaceae archaeon]
MSVYPPTARAKEIWEYSKRELTKNIAVIERTSPSYSSGFTVVLDSVRFLPPNAYFKLNYYGDAGAVVCPDNDILVNANVTLNDPNFVREGALRDRNDNTWGNAPNTVVAPSEEVTELTYDLGEVKKGFLRVVYATLTTFRVVIYISTDGVNYTKIIDKASSANGAKETCYAYAPGTRYIQLRVRNGGASYVAVNDTTCRLFSLEFYPSGITTLRGKDTTTRYMCFVNNAYYQLLEVHEL